MLFVVSCLRPPLIEFVVIVFFFIVKIIPLKIPAQGHPWD